MGRENSERAKNEPKLSLSERLRLEDLSSCNGRTTPVTGREIEPSVKLVRVRRWHPTRISSNEHTHHTSRATTKREQLSAMPFADCAAELDIQ